MIMHLTVPMLYALCAKVFARSTRSARRDQNEPWSCTWQSLCSPATRMGRDLRCAAICFPALCI